MNMIALTPLPIFLFLIAGALLTLLAQWALKGLWKWTSTYVLPPRYLVEIKTTSPPRAQPQRGGAWRTVPADDV